jgi:hypothetical protein
VDSKYFLLLWTLAFWQQGTRRRQSYVKGALAMFQLIDNSLQNANALQNLSAIDRSIRIVIGACLVGTWLFVDIQSMSTLIAVLPLVGALIALSGVLGWCPFYALFGTKSCGVDSHNRCGTLPFQIKQLFKSPPSA